MSTLTTREARIGRWARAVWKRAVANHAEDCPKAKPLHLGDVAHQTEHELAAKAELRAEGFDYWETDPV